MEQYLKEKYGKEFVIESIDYFHPYLGANTEIKGIVHPIDDKEVTFDVRKIADPNKGQYKGTYWENYFYALWEKQFNEKVKHAINSDVTRVALSAPILDINKQIKGRTISLEEAAALYKGRISANVICGMFNKGDENNLSEKEAQKVYSFIKALQDKKFKKIGIMIIYFNVDFKEKVKGDLHEFLRGNFSEYKRMKKKNITLFQIDIEDINRIVQPGDILNYITIY